MTADRRPLRDDLNAFIGGRSADAQTMQRLITSNLVEEFDGTALLTTRGIEAAALLSPTK
jgi:hypothetical protein